MENFPVEYPVLYYVDAVWLGLVSIAGVIGNLLALCAVATTPSLRTSTQLHITILAAVDFVVTAVIVPCRIATEYFSGQWPRHVPWCHFLAYLAIFFIGFSLQQLTFLAQIRYLRVTKSDAVYRRFTSKPAVIGLQVYAVCGTCIVGLLPLYSDFGSVGYSSKVHFCIFTGRNQQLLAILSIVSALGMIPMFYGLTFLHVRAHRRRVGNWRGLGGGSIQPENTEFQSDGMALSVITTGQATETLTTCQHESTTRGNNSSGDQRHLTDKMTIEIPATVNSAAEAPVSRPVPAPKNAARVRPKKGPTKESVKITRNLLLIFCAYICCWLPWCILSLIEPYVDAPVSVHHVLINMLWTNSCINPYLYASMSRNYRKAFRKCLAVNRLFNR
ncbi:G-protein coupled receptor 84-like [Patiria miniata]|uniref:G-protein coupled receptors family 1 profile domain-containing protein n=1 Tax=Patiria miniata TaxID=46514 RepID=A0A914B6F4_PATMI|nr:G-protein coupled receptor 84-like [Patiria miniata]